MNGYNNGPYYGYPAGGAYPPPKKSFSERLKEGLRDRKVRELMILGVLSGLGVLVHLLLAKLSSAWLVSSETVLDMYRNDQTFSLLYEMAYSVVCVALPFVPVFFAMKKLGVADRSLPFGRPYRNSHPLLLIGAGLGLCYLGNIVSNYIYQYLSSFGLEFYSYDVMVEMQEDLPYSAPLILLSVLHTAVFPALTEEFVFRGVIMQPLRRYGDWFAIVSSAVIFGLAHGNIIQTPFAFIAGLALGYVSVVTGSMWVNILLHFLNNFVSIGYSYVLDGLSENMQLLVASLVIYGIITIGIACFISFFLQKKNFLRLRPGRYPGMKAKVRYYFMMPSMAVAIALFVWTILTDIKGFI